MKRPSCPDEFSAAFGRELVAYLGGDSSRVEDDWCWQRFGEEFPELRAGAEAYFASARTGEPARAAYFMCHYCGSARVWAEDVIASARTGDPADAAYLMCRYCGSTRAWAEDVTRGDVSMASGFRSVQGEGGETDGRGDTIY